MSKLLTTTALCMALGLGAAAAQTAQPGQPQPQQPDAQQQQQQPEQQGRFLTKQGSKEMSAEELMGAGVYDNQDQKIGEVNDLIFDDQGQVQAAVIGVGGFLGMGEKEVAVKYDELQSQKQNDGSMRVMLSATKEELQNAPKYAYANEGQDQPATGATPNGGPMTPPNQPGQPGQPGQPQ